ncbi:hypothetical protein [Mucilaginibacter aquaedulcis]|uniref:hypothetical protein n=1 Tax=Mucilaginibacter aquaedulcis TaxID=1187081 RepID=UPI0025B373FD|nr:hypothetical protein [Mucilaginibacter aquaedulcis]MDN3547692.1 hypothetical protein [Mucilaginibacter aquaedulcis]
MKKFNIVLLLALLGGFSVANAQSNTPDGIYIKSADIAKHEVSFPINPVNKSDKIVLNNFFNGGHIQVTNNGRKKEMNKKEIFGYRYQQQDYRLFNNTPYKIIDTSGFYLYSHEQLAPQGKGYITVKVLYFSLNPDGKLFKLTLDDLYKAFINNDKFRYALESEFHTNDDLTVYDSYARMYKVKHVFMSNAPQKQVYSQVK